MKKYIAVTAAALLMVLLATGCGKQSNSIVGEGGLAAVIEDIYDIQETGLTTETASLDLSDPVMIKTYTGLDSSDAIADAAISEPLIGSIAYSLALVQVKNAADAETVASAMLSGVNPAKWICVSADDVKAAVYGDLVLMVMVQSELDIPADDLIEAFRDVCGGKLDAVLSR